MGLPNLAALVHKETVEDVVKAYPRNKAVFLLCEDNSEGEWPKPWAHTTALGEDFSNSVLNNRLMEPYD